MEREKRPSLPELESELTPLAGLHQQLEQINCWLESDTAVENSIDGVFLKERLLEKRDEIEEDIQNIEV